MIDVQVQRRYDLQNKVNEKFGLTAIGKPTYDVTVDDPEDEGTVTVFVTETGTDHVGKVSRGVSNLVMAFAAEVYKGRPVSLSRDVQIMQEPVA